MRGIPQQRPADLRGKQAATGEKFGLSEFLRVGGGGKAVLSAVKRRLSRLGNTVSLARGEVRAGHRSFAAKWRSVLGINDFLQGAGRTGNQTRGTRA